MLYEYVCVLWECMQVDEGIVQVVDIIWMQIGQFDNKFGGKGMLMK